MEGYYSYKSPISTYIRIMTNKHTEMWDLSDLNHFILIIILFIWSLNENKCYNKDDIMTYVIIESLCS